MTADLLSLQNGDRVLVEGVVSNAAPDSGGEIVVQFDRPSGHYGHVCLLASAVREILPPELTVGGRFRDQYRSEGTVLCLHEDTAFVVYDTGGVSCGYAANFTAL